jgi:hypothetical protein
VPAGNLRFADGNQPMVKFFFQALVAHHLLIYKSNEVSTNTGGAGYGGKAQSNT